jgi:hypothetical protein
MTSAKLTKEEARELLQKYINSQRGIFPIYDANILISDERNKTFLVTDYTFRYLLQVAYDLTDYKLTGLL